MSRLHDCAEFYNFIEKVISMKGEIWFNDWVSHNPEIDYCSLVSDDEMIQMINSNGVELPDGRKKIYTSIDYREMLKKLKDDVNGQ